MDFAIRDRAAGRRLRRPGRRRLHVLKAATLAAVLICTTGCQLGYYLHSAYHQSKLLNSRKSIQRVMRSESMSAEHKRKLNLVLEAKEFGERVLGFKKSSNYTSFVQLDEPYVTYIVQAAYAHELKPYLWRFPFVGKVPYKGYFKRALAEEEASAFDKQKFDTHVRGVSAYSTLGWFQDSVLSSMLRYDDHDLVELILHETVHTTLFIKGAAEFNERMATFLGHEGMKLFYLKMEGPDSANLKKAALDSHDQRLFSAFITNEVKRLKQWYEDNQGKVTNDTKSARLNEIKQRFNTELAPRLKTDSYAEFANRELNNAVLLAYSTYEYGLEDFQMAYEKFGRDFSKTLNYFKTLEKRDNPAQVLNEFVR